MKILIIEDDLIITESIRATLEDFGYHNIYNAPSYSGALNIIKEELPDFAIIDIKLVGKKDGIDLAHTISKQYNIPFIFLTGNTEKEALNIAKLSDPYAILIKPFNPDELYAAVNLAIHKHAKVLQASIAKQKTTQIGVYVKTDSKYILIKYSDITYIKSDTIHVKVYTIGNQTYTTRSSISSFSLKLDDNFIRVHRSFIVNSSFISSVNSTHITILSQYIPLGKKYKDHVFNLLNIF